jgi:murein DD-endopeptidase MepM/ murein hydrolase activator NlpD
MFKKILWLVFLVLLLWGFNSQSSYAQGSATYVDPQFGFQFDYPSNWLLVQGSVTDPYTYNWNMRVINQADGYEIGVSVQPISKSLNSSAWTNNFVVSNRLAQNNRNSILIDQVPAERVDQSATYVDEYIYSEVVYVAYNGFGYSIQLLSTDPFDNDAYSEYENLIKSFHFGNTTPTLQPLPKSFAPSEVNATASSFLMPMSGDYETFNGYGNFYNGGYHTAEDRVGSAGTVVKAIANGTVLFSGCYCYPGHAIVIEHILPDNSKIYSFYGHLGSVSVNVGASVVVGQQIGTVYYWPTSYGDNSHLHWETRYMADASAIGGGYTGDGYTSGHPNDFGFTDPSDVVSYILSYGKTSWNFDNGLQAWHQENCLSGGSVHADGGVYFTMTCQDPRLISPVLNISAANYGSIRVRMASQNTNSQCGQVYFQRTIDSGFSESRVVQFSPNSSGEQDYILNMQQNSNWNGTIVRLRLDPGCDPNPDPSRRALRIVELAMITGNNSDQGSLTYGQTYERSSNGTEHRWKLTTTTSQGPILFDIQPRPGGPLTFRMILKNSSGQNLVDTHSSIGGRGIITWDTPYNGDYYLHIIPDSGSSGTYGIAAWANSIPLIRYDFGWQESYSNIRHWQAPVGSTTQDFHVALERIDGNLEFSWQLKTRGGTLLSSGNSVNGKAIASGTASGWVDFYITSLSGSGSYQIRLNSGIPDPGVPTLTTPTSNQQVPNQFNVIIKAGTLNGRGTPDWHVQIDNDSGFTSPVFDNSAAWSKSTTISVNIPTNGTYYIRVRQGDGINRASAFTTPITFKVQSLLPPPPTLISPSHRSHTTDTSPTFTWAPVSGATAYRIRIYQDTGFDQRSLVTGTTNYTPAFLSPGKYTWRVRTKNSAGVWGDYGGRFTLFIDGTSVQETTPIPTLAQATQFPTNEPTMAETAVPAITPTDEPTVITTVAPTTPATEIPMASTPIPTESLADTSGMKLLEADSPDVQQTGAWLNDSITLTSVNSATDQLSLTITGTRLGINIIEIQTSGTLMVRVDGVVYDFASHDLHSGSYTILINELGFGEHSVEIFGLDGIVAIDSFWVEGIVELPTATSTPSLVPTLESSIDIMPSPTITPILGKTNND